jgi:hypothetical protein
MLLVPMLLLLLLVLLLLLLLQELGGSVPARLVFRAQGLAEGWKDPNIRRAVVRGMWLLVMLRTCACAARSCAQRRPTCTLLSWQQSAQIRMV